MNQNHRTTVAFCLWFPAFKPQARPADPRRGRHHATMASPTHLHNPPIPGNIKFVMKIDELRERLAVVRAELRQMGVSSLAVFGSVARGEALAGSDVDLLVEFDQPVDLLQFVALRQFLAETLGCRVDLATRGALRPEMREAILKEATIAA